MNEWQNLIPIALLCGFFGWKFYQRFKMKNLIPHLLEKGGKIVDVRTREEFQGGSNPHSINIPLDEIDKRSHELDKNIPLILCCASGGRSAMATTLLKRKGFKEVYNAGPWTNTL